MKKLLLLCVLTNTALGQLVRYEGDVTAASSVSAEARTPEKRVARAIVTVCGYPSVGAPCTNTVPVFGDQAGKVPLHNPLTTDASGEFKLWINRGSYAYTVQTSAGVNVGTYTMTFAGGGAEDSAAWNEAAVQPARSSATGSALGSGQNSAQGGKVNTDLLGGVAAAHAATASMLETPSTSMDKTSFGSLPVLAGKPSAFWMDYRGNQLGITATNPRPSSLARNQYQAMMNGSVAYTEKNQGVYQGGQQLHTFEENYFLAPSHDNGQAGCPNFCPAKGYIQDQNGNIEGATTSGRTGTTLPSFSNTPGSTTHDGTVVWTNYGPGTTTGRWPADSVIGVSDWGNSFYENITNYFNTMGIHGRGGQSNWSFGKGDFQAHGYEYPVCEGGESAPNDEGCYMGEAFIAATAKDWAGTLMTITDANHIVATPTINNMSQGDGRFLIDITSSIHGTDGQPLTGLVDQVTTPSGAIYGTVVMNSGNMPISYAQGKLAKDCRVPVQDGTVEQTSCTITVTSGTFDTASPVCMANVSSDMYVFGGQPLSVTSLSGGTQTITTKINKSVAAGGFVFQGGMCGAMVSLDADINSFPQGVTYPSVFMIIGSTDAHTAAYASYYASGIWASIPSPGSQFLSKANSATALTNLVRTGNVVTATLANPGRPVSDTLNYSNNFTIAGCTDATMNATGTDGKLSQQPDGTVQFSYRQAGANSTCAKATYYSAAAKASFYWGTEVYDVVDHTPGLTAKESLNGHFLTSYQPHFATGHTLDMPPHYSLGIEGIRANMNMSEPAHTNHGIAIFGGNDSALGGANLYIANGTIAQGMAGTGGTGVPNTGIEETGYFTCALCMHYAPMHHGAILKVGYPPPGYKDNTYFGNYDIVALENGNKALNYDMASGTIRWKFSNSDVWDISATGTIANQSTVMKNAQFEAENPGTGKFAPATQFTECGVQNALNAPCYDNVTAAPTITNTGTPGKSVWGYLIGIRYPNGTMSYTPRGITKTSNATLDNVNYNVISCSVLPAGTTGTVYTYLKTSPNFAQVGAAGACSNAAATVKDTGTYGPPLGNAIVSMGADMNVGRLVVNGNGGSVAWTQKNNFSGAPPVNPLTVMQGISAPSPGAFSFDTTSKGNGLGVITGPPTAPSGACSTIGWIFSQDGHATFCNGKTWVTKI